MLTLIFIVAFDILLRQVNFADMCAVRSIDLWGVPARIVDSQRVKPQLATIGSSLLMVVHPIDLSNQFEKFCNQQVTCVNLCSGTQMVSEVFMITEALTSSGQDYPKVLMFGTSLRDFVNDMYALEWTGESFNSIAPYVPVDPQAMRHIYSVNAQQQLWLCHYWYLWRNRLDFKNIMFAYTKDLLDQVLPLDEPFERLGPDRTWRAQKEGILYERWIPRTMGSFTAQIDQRNPKFLKDYYTDYQRKMWKDERGVAREIEGHYFMELIKHCKEKGITLIVVNMPVSLDMEKLAPGTAYKDFSKTLESGCAAKQFLLVDLTQDKDFKDEMFIDGLHLRPEGAHLVAEKLAQLIKANYPQVLSVIAEQRNTQEKTGAAARHQ